jgi:outer membrane protein assembly factor BamB
MNIARYKTTATTIAIFLVLTIAAPCLTLLPTVYAADINVPTYLFIVAVPDPVGVGQPISVVMMNSRVPAQFSNGTSVLWQNYVLTTTKPDGTTQNTTYTSDYVGSWNAHIVPDQVGNWSFQFSFPGQVGAATFAGMYFEPATSAKVEVTVQQEPIQYLPETPLPTDYWTRPINAENTYWWSISGNWLCKGYDVGSLDSNFAPYTTAPNSAHILWATPIAFGGIAGGAFPSTETQTQSAFGLKELTGGASIEAYNPLWLSPLGSAIIINGWIYYRWNGGLECRDIRTGKEIWWQNGTSITCGQVLQFNSAQGMGDFAYLWRMGTTYSMYDAYTGNWILDLANASTPSSGPGGSAAPIYGPNGEMLVYLMGGMSPHRWLAMWNSTAVTRMMTAAYGVPIAQEWSWSPPQGATLNWPTGIQWNVTLATAAGNTPTITKLDPKQPDIIYSRQSFTLPDTTVITQDMGISLKPGQEGQIVWGPVNRTVEPSGPASLSIGSGVFVEYQKETGTVRGYDIYTGIQLWSTQIATTGFSVYQQESFNAGYGKEYFGTYEGITYCIDLKNGTLLWKFYSGNSGLNTPYGEWPFYGGTTLADGKLYAVTGEHTPINPIWKGEKMFCIDVNTGQNIWNITGLWFNPLIADGYALAVNAEDNQLYSFGKGQTDTTVGAPMTAVPLGSSVMITGTVTDQSPGEKDTPAISDNDMTAWMQYLYMQQPKPTNAKGVEVSLDTVDPNGNYVHIGTVTSDITGAYGYKWTPDVPGTYQIIATFAGSESYWPSSAQTYVGVDEAPPTTAAPEYPQPIDPTLTIVGTGIAIIIAVAIVGILLFRKK